MKSRKDKEKTSGFFCRKVFMEQLVLLETPAQFLELFEAAYAYIDDEEFEIKDNMVKMAFSSWKIALNYDKEYHKERKANSIKANEAKKKKREAKGNILMNSPSDEESAEEPPLADTEEVEQYPFEEFWKLYGMQIGENECRMKWSRMRESTKAKVMEHLPKYVASTPNKQYRAEPFNYLSRGYYNNEIIDRTQTNTNSYGSNNGKSYKEAEFERNARTAIENLQAAERGELAYFSPFNPPSGQH